MKKSGFFFALKIENRGGGGCSQAFIWCIWVLCKDWHVSRNLFFWKKMKAQISGGEKKFSDERFFKKKSVVEFIFFWIWKLGLQFFFQKPSFSENAHLYSILILCILPPKYPQNMRKSVKMNWLIWCLRPMVRTPNTLIWHSMIV